MRNSMPRNVSSTAMHTQKPTRPYIRVMKIAGRIRTTHMDPKFITLGQRVSPAPTKAP